MLKRKYLILCIAAIIVGLLMLPGLGFASTGGRSQADAVAWAQARANEGWNQDVDGFAGCQCVDLIMAYYEYLGNSRARGNGCDYEWISLPSGWYRDNTPSPGAIAVWAGNTKLHDQWTLDAYGHVGIVVAVNGSSLTTVESNVKGQFAQYCNNRPAGYVRCYIHPDFSSVPISFSFSVWSERQSVGQTSASVGTYINPTGCSASQVTAVGCDLYDAKGNWLAGKQDNFGYVDPDNRSRLKHYYPINDDPKNTDIKYRLTPSTKYQYRYSVWVNGKRYYSDYYTFKTEPLEVTVTYDANGGSSSTASKKVTFGSKYGTLATATRKGYDFTGWYTEAKGGTKITSSTKVTATSNHTIFAHWELKPAPTLIVTYDANGGSCSTASKTVTSGEEYGTLAKATRKGYDFNGWYTKAKGGTKITSSTKVTATSDHTIYAQWTLTTPPAADPATEPPADKTNSAKLSASSSSIGDDGTFVVTLSISGNPGIGTMRITSDFSDAGVSLIRPETTGIASGATITGASRISMMSANDVTGDGQFAQLTFNANNQDTVTLHFNVDKATKTDGSNVVISGTSVSAQRGKSRTPGDANDDGTVDLVDAMMILRYDCGWNESINMSNSDVNGDGTVDLVDAMMVLRYDCGWDVNLI